MTSRFDSDEILSLGLVADILSVSKETVRKWEKNGTLPKSRATPSGTSGYCWKDLLKFPAVAEIANSQWNSEEIVRPLRSYRSIELFAGAGGLALGMEVAGFENAVFNEFNHDACETLRKNRPEWNVIEGDVAKIDFTRYKGIDFVSGGFPCQAFSYAGNRAGFDDTRGTLFFEFARVLRETRPKVFLGENVRGLLTHDSGKTLKVIQSVIADLGYTLVEPRVLKAIFYCVPQKRERLALVGIRNDLAEHIKHFKWPSPAGRVYTMRDALCAGELFDCDVPVSAGVFYTKRKAEIIAEVPPGGYWRDLPDALQREFLKGSYHLEGGKTGMARRLSWDEPSLTLTCAPAQNQTGRCHPSETRPLTVREYARIQTFPDNWSFCGSVMSQYKQIGNAVPVNLAAALGRQIIALLNVMTSARSGLVSKKNEKEDVQKPEAFTGGYRYQEQSSGVKQLLLFQSSALYLIQDMPVTLLGTYRKICRDWILEKKLYNYPVTDADLDAHPELLSVRRLILGRGKDAPLYFSVEGYSLETKAKLEKLKYPSNKRHSSKSRYILYKLHLLAEPPPEFDLARSRLLVGKGTKAL